MSISTIVVSPATVQLSLGQTTQPFTAVAYDQNGVALSVQPAFAWSVSLPSIGSDGLLSAPGAYTITASAEGVSGTASASSTIGLSQAAIAALVSGVWNYPTPDDLGQTPIGETVASTRLESVAASQNAVAVLTRLSPEVVAKITGAQQANAAVMLPANAPTGYGGGLTVGQATMLSNLNTRLSDARAGFLDFLDPIKTGVTALLSMTEVVSNVRQFLSTALALAPASSGGNGGSVPSGGPVLDINYTGYALSKNAFWATAREIMAITVKGEGGGFPTQAVNSAFYIAFTPIAQTTAPAVSDCIRVNPYPDGHDLEARLLIGMPENLTASTPTKTLAPGSYKVWLWIVGPTDALSENILEPIGQITVLA